VEEQEEKKQKGDNKKGDTITPSGIERATFRIGFFKWSNPSSRIVALGSTKPLTETSTRNIPGGKGRLARKADNLTAICEPTV
jgi:hypothetical protein